MTTPAAAILAGDIVAGNPLAAAASPLAEVVLFYLFGGLTAASALAVVLSRNIVRMSVALMFALAAVAGLFFLLHAEFLAAVQLVVYVGGTLILIVFGVMLTSKSPFSRLEPTRAQVVLATALAVVLLATLALARPTAEASVALPASAVPAFLLDGGAAVAGLRYDPGRQRLTTDRRLLPEVRQGLLDRAAADARLASAPDRRAFGRAVDELAAAAGGLPAKRESDPNAPYPMDELGVALLGEYLLPFELASVLLLAVMIGAAYLAKGRRRDEPIADGKGPAAAASSASRQAREWS